MLRKLIIFFIYLIKDTIKSIKHRKELKFAGYGIRVFVGIFGAGKTSSMVEYAYRQAKRYPGLNILTVMELYNFPKDTIIQKLTSYKQIIDAPNHTLVILDEFSSLFPASEWHKGIPKSLKAIILQVRKKNIMILGTAQEFVDLYVFFRRHTFTVHECQCLWGRWNFVSVYGGKDYERLKCPDRVDKYSFIQTDNIRQLYDTNELIMPINMNDVYQYDEDNAEALESELNNLQGYHGKSLTGKKKRGRPKKNQQS